jgi:hypothetical protein
MDRRRTMAEEDREIRRYLVVVVGMLAGPNAGEGLYRLSQRQPSRFQLVVPATKPDYGWTWSEGQALADAKQRLELMLEFTGKLGMRVDGLVYSHAEPVEAVREVVASAEEPFDELIVIDRPKGHAQRWMASSSLKQLQDDPGLPITHLEANPPLVQGKDYDPDENRRLFEEWRRGLGDQ